MKCLTKAREPTAWTLKEIEGTRGKNGWRVAILAFAQCLVLLVLLEKGNAHALMDVGIRDSAWTFEET